MVILENVPEFFRGYVSNVEDTSIVIQLIQEGDHTLSIYKNLMPSQVEYRYAEGKWTVKELLAHMIDAERVFAYRALCFARNEKKVLHGFDEEMYSKEMNIHNR
ncbi:MAG: DinB family protein, partial [Cyclobacteriaceae bacterium]|nr:DinB family protein [Cyclobacteriaceae bacterium]